MGSSLSRQEELFLHREWTELLQNAMEADLNTLPSGIATSAPETAVDSNEGGGDVARRTDVSAKSAVHAKKGKKKGDFQLSFQEWQAFLSALEQKEPSSVPSDIAARLTATQLHVPAVVLMVHVCAWWRGAISASALGDRVEHLVKLVSDAQHAGHSPAPEKDLTTAEETGSGSDTAPASRRARLARLVQRKVVDRAWHRAATHQQSPTDECLADGLLLDTFRDLACLVQELLTQDTHSTIEGDKGPAPPSTSAAATSKLAREIVELYDKKISNQDVLQQRPVLAVVMVVVLAIFAAKDAAQPQLAVRSVAHLEALEALLFRSSGAIAAKIESSASAPLATLWPVMAELEVALVHRQHEADILQCLSSEGDALMATLRQMREKREGLHSNTAAGTLAGTRPSPVSLTPSERWSAGASQYIGQRPIWSQLRSHFLSAGVFDADKPTVLVFFGPSGYGKSELAKRIASVLHDCPMSELESSGKMVYIHMPSFCTKDSIYSLVDPPAAHVGSGILLSALQQHPDAVVVLDEFEKSTAESINNLWLSAFQKNGVLRSLKEASRSVSTVHTTFILTCNISADAIAAREDLYLNASPADQEAIRNLFVTQCKDICRVTMGDPFVNRVDSFFPFMPYTAAERRQFVCLLLERLLASQAPKGRLLSVTPGFVEAMVDKLHTFHAATLEEAVRSQVMCMVRAGWTSAVLTVERRIGGSAVVLLPATTGSSAASSAQLGGLAPGASEDGADDSDGGTRSLLVEAWDTLPGGIAAMQKWSSALEVREAATSPAAPRSTTEEEHRDSAKPVTAADAARDAQRDRGVSAAPVAKLSVAPAKLAPQPSTSPLLEKQYDMDYATDKAKILELEKELEKTRETVKQRDMEIVTLKEKVLLLQKALAVVVLALASCLCVLAVVIGLKLTLIFALAMVSAIVFVLGVPLALLLEAVRALFRVLGPFKGGVLALLMAMWITKATKSIMSCS